MVASLLYYINSCNTINPLGFKINPYDSCVANRAIDDNQQTICWHVVDCKISNIDPKVNGKLIKSLEQEYISIFEDRTGEMTFNRGNKHKYIGMKLDYFRERYCRITMFENLKAILETFDKIDAKKKIKRRSQRRRIYSQCKNTARRSTRNVVSSSTALWDKCCSLLNVLGLTQSHQSNFWPQDSESQIRTTG